MKMYIVLYKDGCMLPVRVKPEKESYQSGARFFEVEKSVDLDILSYWYAQGNKLENFKEI